jgi:hypothetical protein
MPTARTAITVGLSHVAALTPAAELTPDQVIETLGAVRDSAAIPAEADVVFRADVYQSLGIRLATAAMLTDRKS